MRITVEINREEFKQKLGVRDGVDGIGIGIDGSTPTKEELLTLIQPLIPQVKDGETPTKEQLIELMRPLIPIKSGGGNLMPGTLKYFLKDNVVPTGTIDGNNKVFVLPDVPIASTLKVHADGARQKVTTDYTLSGNTITFIIAPASSVLCDYRV